MLNNLMTSSRETVAEVHGKVDECHIQGRAVHYIPTYPVCNNSVILMTLPHATFVL